MKKVSLKIDDSIFGETEAILSKINKPRNRYINEALEYYNKIQKRKLLELMLKKESSLVKTESLSVLNEFEQTGYVPCALCPVPCALCPYSRFFIAEMISNKFPHVGLKTSFSDSLSVLKAIGSNKTWF